MRILALDWGTVRIGAAISDPEGMMAFPMEKFIESKDAINEIQKLVADKEIEKILIGLPKNLSGESSASSKLAQEFGEKLKNEVSCGIVFIDERLSSVGAHKTLSDQGVSQKNQRLQVDNLAAAQLLQSYLDTNK